MGNEVIASPTTPARTVGKSVTMRGVGIHTGALSSVTLHPAPPGAGVAFRAGGGIIPALAENVIDTGRCTVLGAAGVSVSTVEHLLSALAGFGVTDALIEVEGPELPIGDGGAQIWADALTEARIVTIGEIIFPLLDAPLIETGKGSSFIAAYPADSFRATVAITFDHALVGTQIARFDAARDDYAREIAPARTFGFIEEVEALRAAGLAKGGSLDNAIIVYPDRYSVPLSFPDELARHKLLDLLGDLTLAGVGPLPSADIIAVKPSHRLNTAFAARWQKRVRGGA